MARAIKQSEASLHQQVVNYLKWQYPNVLFRTDFAAGIKMTIGQAVKHKKLQKCKAWPDLFIAEKHGNYNGLFIEIKKAKEDIYLKSGAFKNDVHINEQREMLEELRKRGYAAFFGCGFESIIVIINEYLKWAA